MVTQHTIIQRYGLDKYDRNDNPVDDKPAADTDTPLPEAEKKQFVVQAGAFKYKKNATKRLAQVTALGGEFKKAFIAKTGENYTIQTGVFENEQNARNMAAALEKANIEWMIKVR